ncbi:MFS general substrate transporter [Rickenella mellea]|uniref:MFS general substrate transporter n=1 Tax=Rickenella mellea TaxID=50990 RepID=A0A4Y7PN30_9AGAM|nr:MFS general substrate transporter [Rickenella mellea]
MIPFRSPSSNHRNTSALRKASNSGRDGTIDIHLSNQIPILCLLYRKRHSFPRIRFLGRSVVNIEIGGQTTDVSQPLSREDIADTSEIQSNFLPRWTLMAVISRSLMHVAYFSMDSTLAQKKYITNDASAKKSFLFANYLRLMPLVALIFLLNYVDRNAVATARLQGLEKDLHLEGVQYQTVIAILYLSYAPAQIPSNMILNRVTRPSLYIGGCVVLWGMISALTATTRSFSAIIVCRIFLGLPEAAFYPGTMYLLSRWYTRKELAFRSSILFSGLLLSNAFGSLIAAGILSTMEGKRGIRAWRWLFLTEGTITIFIGFQVMWILPDYPNNTRWLTSDERLLAQARIAEDAGEADQDTTEDTAFSGLNMAVRDPKVALFVMMTMFGQVAASFVNYFPTLVATLGFNTTATLLLVSPPWICSTIACIVNATHADKTGERFFHTAGPYWVMLVGYAIALSTSNFAARYFSTFLLAVGYCGIPLVWVTNSFPRPPAKRAAAMGIVNGLSNFGSLAGAFVWNSKWGPGYHISMVIGIVAIVMHATCALAIRTILVRKNRQLDRDELAEVKESNRERVREAARLEGITLDTALERRKGFRYLY